MGADRTAVDFRSFSPRELADVVGVSESSVKRWVDAGRIGVGRTVGGHRRIPLRDAVRFIRSNGLRVDRADLFGFGAVLRPFGSEPEWSVEAVLEAADRPGGVRSLLLQAYLDGAAPAELFDGVMARAMDRFGSPCEFDPDAVHLEHRFTQAALEAVSQCRMLQPVPTPGAPGSIGGSPERDPYLLPGLMASTVLAEEGYSDVYLGAFVPVTALERAAESTGARLVWLSATSPLTHSEMAEWAAATTRMLDAGQHVCVGGRAAVGRAAEWPDRVRVLSSMALLAKISRTLA